MNKKELIASEMLAAKNPKTLQDLTRCTQMLIKISIEVALNADMDTHLRYENIHYKLPQIAKMAIQKKLLKLESINFT